MDYQQLIQQLQAQRGGAPQMQQPMQRPMMGANGMPVGAPQRRPQQIRGPMVAGPQQTAETMQPDAAQIQQELLAQQQGMR